jgi:hypothetical protein
VLVFHCKNIVTNQADEHKHVDEPEEDQEKGSLYQSIEQQQLDERNFC